MKSSLSLALSIFALSFQLACGSVEDSSSETLSANKCSGKPLTNSDLLRARAPAAKGFQKLSSKLFKRAGSNHRARDIIAQQGGDATLHAKFSYGLVDKDLKGEKVDIYLSVNCAPGFKKLGTATTSSKDNSSNVVENVKDSGGRIFTKLSDLGVKDLPVGRHQLLYVVQGDNTFTEAFLDIVPRNTKYVVSDIDGTLTTSEFAAALDVAKLVIKPLPASKANPGAAKVLSALSKQGYKIFYLTARPEWMTSVTRQWLYDNGFPQGTLHTTDKLEGAQGEAAKEYKIAEIKLFKQHTGATPSFAFGNKPSDVDAFGQSGISASNSYYIKLEGDARGGVIHDDYNKILPIFEKRLAQSY